MRERALGCHRRQRPLLDRSPAALAHPPFAASSPVRKGSRGMQNICGASIVLAPKSQRRVPCQSM